MTMMELATIAKYKLPVKVFIIKNNTLGQIKWEQIVIEGNPEFGVRPAPDRLRQVRRGGAACPGSPWTQAEDADAVDRRGVPQPARPWSSAWSTRTSRPCPATPRPSRP